jgi:hypothetical protein
MHCFNLRFDPDKNLVYHVESKALNRMTCGIGKTELLIPEGMHIHFR